MALPRFFDRVFAAAGNRLSVGRESLELALREQSIAILCGPECGQVGNARWIAELLTNLCARLYPRLTLDADTVTAAHLAAIARRVNPKISLKPRPGEATATVCVGTVTIVPDQTIFASASGWVAHLHYQQPPDQTGPANPYAAGAAAALAAAEIFRKVFANHIHEPVPSRDVRLSLLDFTEASGLDRPLTALDLGQVAFVGLGAVGGPALWALARHPGLSGEAFLVDPDTIELSNLQRYLLAFDADIGRKKTDIASRELNDTKIKRRLKAERLDTFAASFGGVFPLPTVCVSVDNVEGRRTAQALLPRLVVNGWTGDAGLGVSWHEFSREAACLACMYQPHGVGPSQVDLVAEALGLAQDRAALLWITGQAPSDDELRAIGKYLDAPDDVVASWHGRALPALYSQVICGAVPLDLRGIGRVESVPLAHQSVLAGLLMAAELVKRLDPSLTPLSQTECLAVWDDVLRPPPTNWLQPRPREPHCICGDLDYQDAFTEKWGAIRTRTS